MIAAPDVSDGREGRCGWLDVAVVGEPGNMSQVGDLGLGVELVVVLRAAVAVVEGDGCQGARFIEVVRVVVGCYRSE